MRYVSLSRLLAEIRESMPATDAQAMAIALYAIFWRLVPLAALVWVLVLVVGPRHSGIMVVALAVNALLRLLIGISFRRRGRLAACPWGNVYPSSSILLVRAAICAWAAACCSFRLACGDFGRPEQIFLVLTSPTPLATPGAAAAGRKRRVR